MNAIRAAFVSGVLIFAGVALSGAHFKFAVIWPWLVTAGVAAGVLGVAEMVKGNFARAVVVAAGLVGLAVWFAGWVPEETPGYEVWPWGLVLGGPVLLIAVFVGLRGRSGSRGLVHRWSRRARRNDGMASRWQIFRVASRFAMRRKATTLRPSLRQVSRWRRLRVPTTEYATALARVGGQRIWSPIEDVTLRMGGPRTGKTGELAGRILDAPGAVIATSTRTDLVELTGPVRRQRGPVFVFNPCGLGGLESTITFNPLSWCELPATAVARSADLLAGGAPSGGDSGEREYWTTQARRVLAALLHAAALGELTMRDVLAWVSNPDDAEQEITRLLRRSPEPAFEADAVQFLKTNDRTRSSITTTIMPALGWLTNATAAKAAEKGDFDVAELLESRGTVYMLGAEDAQVAPLVTALTGHIAREARLIAGTCPGGRLDPPLTLALDEAALICPIPLDVWTADMGGRNMTIHIAAQSRAQLRQRWGDTGAAALMNNSATLLIFGGTRDADDLNAYSTLTAERDEMVGTEDLDGNVTSRSPRRVPVLSPGQLAQLPAGRVVIIRRGMPTAIGKVRMSWKRRDVKAAARTERNAARSERWLDWRDEFATRLAAFVDMLTDRIEPWVARLDERAAARRAERLEAESAAAVTAEAMRLDDHLSHLDSQLDGQPAADGDGDGEGRWTR